MTDCKQVFDCGLIGEGALHILAAAWSKSLLHDDAVVIPSSGRVSVGGATGMLASACMPACVAACVACAVVCYGAQDDNQHSYCPICCCH